MNDDELYDYMVREKYREILRNVHKEVIDFPVITWGDASLILLGLSMLADELDAVLEREDNELIRDECDRINELLEKVNTAVNTIKPKEE